MKRVKFFVLLIFCMSVMFMFTSCKKEVELKDYYELRYDGFSGDGRAELVFLSDKFSKECLKKETNILGFGLSFLFQGSIEASIDKQENLSNGDVVHLTFKVDNESLKENKELASLLNVRLKGGTSEVTISGLKEYVTVDPSKYLMLDLDGRSPNIDFAYNWKEFDEKTMDKEEFDIVNDLIIPNCVVIPNKSHDIRNGDKLTLKIKYDEEDFKRMGVLVSKDSIELPVEGYDGYILNYNEIDQDSLNYIYQDFEKEAQDKFYGSYSYYYIYDENEEKLDIDKNDITLKELKPNKAYFLSLKDGKVPDVTSGLLSSEVYNILFVDYTLDYSYETESGEIKDDTMYVTYIYYNIRKDNGLIDIEHLLSGMSRPEAHNTKTYTFNTYVQKRQEKYDVEEIDLKK